jgi:hypothetical protein
VGRRQERSPQAAQSQRLAEQEQRLMFWELSSGSTLFAEQSSGTRTVKPNGIAVDKHNKNVVDTRSTRRSRVPYHTTSLSSVPLRRRQTAAAVALDASNRRTQE